MQLHYMGKASGARDWCREIPNTTTNSKSEKTWGGGYLINHKRVTAARPIFEWRAHFSRPNIIAFEFGFVLKAFGRAQLQVFSCSPFTYVLSAPPRPDSSGTFHLID